MTGDGKHSCLINEPWLTILEIGGGFRNNGLHGMVGGVKDARKTLQCHKGLTDFVVNLRHMV